MENQDFKIGDQVRDAHGRRGTVLKITKRTIKVKLLFSTVQQTLNSPEGIFSFWKI